MSEDTLSQDFQSLLSQIEGLKKAAFQPVPPPAGAAPPPGAMPPGGQPPMGGGGAPPVDPATGMPIDPATGMPIDPATGMPMDPAAMGGMPPMPPEAGGPPPPAALPPEVEQVISQIMSSVEQMAMALEQASNTSNRLQDQFVRQTEKIAELEARLNQVDKSLREPSSYEGPGAESYSGEITPEELETAVSTLTPEQMDAALANSMQ